MASKGIKEKAAKLDFSNLAGLPKPAAGAATTAKTAPGLLMAHANEARSDLLRANETLRLRAEEGERAMAQLEEVRQELQQWDGAKAVRRLDPRLITASRYANRHAATFTGKEFEQLKADIAGAGGNVEPVKVRPLVGGAGAGDGPQFELVYGHRRHRACLDLELPVLAMVDNVDDQTLFAEMDRENRARNDLSPWEQGMMYRRALDAKLFPSARKLADALDIDLTGLGRLLLLASLPEWVVQAFGSPLELQYRWAKPLTDALTRDEAGVRARAADLVQRAPRPAAKVVFETLVGAGSTEARGARPVLVAGAAVGSVRMTPKGLVLQLEPGISGKVDVDALVGAVQGVLVRSAAE